MPRLVSKLLLLILVLLPLTSWAISGDRDQPIEIEADHAQLDDQQGITQYKGKAILTQGTLRIEGDIITFYYDDDKQLTKMVAQGNPATYKQIQKAGEKPVRAKALQMEYYAKSQKIYLLGQGHVWKDGSKFSGERIEYDIDKNIVNISGRANQTSKPKPNQRIHIIIQPPGRTKKPSVKPVEVIPVPKPTSNVEPAVKDDSYPTAITLSNLNIRTGPGTRYHKLGVLNSGEEIFVLTEQKNWLQVRGIVNKQVIIGWVNRQYIRIN